MPTTFDHGDAIDLVSFTIRPCDRSMMALMLQCPAHHALDERTPTVRFMTSAMGSLAIHQSQCQPPSHARGRAGHGMPLIAAVRAPPCCLQPLCRVIVEPSASSRAEPDAPAAASQASSRKSLHDEHDEDAVLIFRSFRSRCVVRVARRRGAANRCSHLCHLACRHANADAVHHGQSLWLPSSSARRARIIRVKAAACPAVPDLLHPRADVQWFLLLRRR